MAPAVVRVAAALLGAVIVSPAWAEGWPAGQPITMVLPSGPGGSSDPLARLLAEEMGKRLNQSIVVVNRPGAGGNVGMAQAARAKPDGYTVVLSWTGPLATNLALYRDVGWNPSRDLVPVGMVGCTPNVLAVSPTFPASSLPGFLDYARAHSGAVSYGTTGVGSSWHIAGEMLNQKADGALVHIPYPTPGGPMADLAGGRLQAIFPVIPMTVPHVRASTLKVLVVFSERRSAVLPEVPTTAEAGYPGLVSETCFALLAPTGIPAEVIARLNGTLNDVLAAPATRERVSDMGLTIQTGAPDRVTAFLATEVPRQASIVHASGARAD
ncbi:tripartite tricarboxylate transporter substrate binding protein [Pseudoroseomonas wenyumeiae]|uniref:Tripartite tricarboxylate transporter substrate binding protein n=1 Tax=Teichococcus wenyumeiae TaxID=2478470 RepID=A0A3A9JBU1_9PROT|nr:tripartite tricarboxylate transporter substrate binding protein [Pseudoroseomonas wenyumeiae]RKK02153.1 tripartite tricarboxylate transporter substrate binding protein [Pseudoroseomonas wenyumeiae]RMI15273.1 tripartite tricarboxylate transporter substrate binding protein [Pseudoroseomonas wenyumeiae]